MMAEPAETVLLFTKDDKRYKLGETTYVEYADKIMRNRADRNGGFSELTTTKLRSIYGLVANLMVKIGSEDDYDRHKQDIQYLKVKMAYEAGREMHVRRFLDNSHLMDMVDSAMSSYAQWQLYCRYAESLVAYFKFYGGKDN
jgi:CRISPR-associated protein Csm2